MKEKFVPVDKMSKRKRKALNAEKRIMNGFNTGTQIHAVRKYPTRAQAKANFLKEI